MNKPIINTKLNYERLYDNIDIDFILNHININKPLILKPQFKKNPNCYIRFDKFNVKIMSKRLYCFKNSGIKCVKCGIEGKYFALERIKNTKIRPHFNLYAVNENNKEILMTVDHIIPISKGGKTTIDNLQTMCSKCNHEKGDKIE